MLSMKMKGLGWTTRFHIKVPCGSHINETIHAKAPSIMLCVVSCKCTNVCKSSSHFSQADSTWWWWFTPVSRRGKCQSEEKAWEEITLLENAYPIYHCIDIYAHRFCCDFIFLLPWTVRFLKLQHWKLWSKERKQDDFQPSWWMYPHGYTCIICKL